ncbi:MAG: SPFH domain-containing protein [bacterium]|nr:SPFH domain-containing protein [bacterium]
MKNAKVLTLILIISAIFTINGCTSVSVNAGEEAVMISKPLLFGHGEVYQTPVSTGRTWAAFTTSYVIYNIMPVNRKEHFENLITNDNTPIMFDANLTLQIISGETPKLHQKFGTHWFENNIQPTLREAIRDKACTFKMFDLAGKREVLIQVVDYTIDALNKHISKIGLPVKVIGLTISQVTPPPQVLEETQRTAAQNQSILTQEARAMAELSRKQAEINKADADLAYQKHMGMTIPQYLSLRQLEIQKEQVELVKDNKNVTVIFGGGQSGVPITYPVK